MIKFLVDFLSQPTVVLGLVAMIGLIAMKNSVSDVISGTFKTERRIQCHCGGFDSVQFYV